MATPSFETPLPTVRALEALWRQVTRRPLYVPPNFWRYARLRLRARLRLLDPRRVPVVAPPGKINDCSSCTRSCCLGPRSTVLLRLRDIATLVDVGRTDLMTHAKPAFDEAELQARPALRQHVSTASWKRFPVLRQNAFGACGALSSEGRCTLFPHWPLSCARFPYALHLADGDVFYSPRCDSFWIHPRAEAAASEMAALAVTSYNERIKDLILLEYAPAQLDALGLLRFTEAGTYR
jgi:Fe-S-cluster containining protein